jgi:hypothetical protein
MTLPPFPVDDVTLLAVEHALDACLSYDEATEQFTNVGSDYSLDQLCEMLSGVDPTKWVPSVDDDGFEIPGMVEYPDGPIYHPNDIIRALIAEVRRLR